LGHFQNVIDNFEIVHEDVAMRLLCQSLFGYVSLWFKNLEDCSIGSWDDFHGEFLRYWGEKKSFDQYLNEFNSLRKEEDEALATFNRKFHIFYCNMPLDI
jgi:hypothetical protein